MVSLSLLHSLVSSDRCLLFDPFDPNYITTTNVEFEHVFERFFIGHVPSQSCCHCLRCSLSIHSFFLLSSFIHTYRTGVKRLMPHRILVDWNCLD